MKNIILGVTGSISAYKAADIVSRLVKQDYSVHVVMTKASTAFITPLTMQALSKHRVYINVLQEEDPHEIIHISLAQKADALVIAPATANIIGKIAGGIADDMLSCVVLAAQNIPLLIAPAMNTRMYENSVVHANLQKLTDLGWQVIEPRVSTLACGDTGKGALANVDSIVQTINQSLDGGNNL